MVKISIIVPVYNVEKYIHRCIDSILSQTFTNFELILVDDGSPDLCGKICDEYEKKDKRIKVIHKKNGGLSDARNAGLEVAQGEFIGFVDSDDYIESDMYEKLLKACELNNSKIAMCGRYNVIGENMYPLFSFEGCKIWESREAIDNLLSWENIDSSACDKLFSKELFENIRFPVGKYNEDIFVMCHIIHNSGKIVHIGDAKYFYFHRQNSITTEKFSEKKLDLLEATGKVISFVKDNYPNLYAKSLSFHYKGIIYLITLFDSKTKEKHQRSYLLLKKMLRKNFILIVLNKYVDKKVKFITVLNFINLFYFLRKIKISLLKIVKKEG